MKVQQRIIILFLLFYSTACLDALKPLNVKDDQKVVEISKGPCFGNCPVYTLSIYETGIAVFSGEQNTDRRGVYMKKIGKERARQITNKCVAANLWQFRDVYKSNFPDLPTVTLTYYEGKESKTISGKRERPDEVISIEQMLDEIAFSDGWEQVEAPPSNYPPGAITNELIVKLNRGIEALAWSKRYTEQEVSLKKALSNDKTYWLITFNDKLIDPNEMIETLRRDKDVFSVQFNQNFQ